MRSPRIPDDVRDKWKQKYLDARSVDELESLHEAVSSKFGHVFNDFVRDGWIAASFARARGCKRVRLVADQWPDFAIEYSGCECQFEAVEADVGSRRRDDEYREYTRREASSEATLTHDPEENWLTPNKAAGILRCASQRKAAKQYVRGASLVIYLNPGEYGTRQAEVEAVMTEATASAKDAFESVWVLWKGKAYHLWQNGRAVSSS